MNSTQASQRGYYERALKAFEGREFEEAAAICRDAANELERNANFHDASVAYDLLGTAHYRLGALTEAKSSYLKSLEVADRAGGTADREYAKTFNSLAAVTNAMGDHEEAMAWLAKSLRINEACQSKTGLVSTYHQLGVVEHSRSNLAEARQWYSKAISLADPKHDIERIVAAVRCFAATMSDDDEPEDVNKVYRIATDAMEANGDIEAAKNAAEQARREFDFRASTEFYRKTLEMAEKQLGGSCS
ncbi:tetratricopeptide repeat protein [Candidatus Laterigemmans baculatus]|uniref:tetratricopeptide repeat protein n=1 Tax=Candidatus Laterigemmans baculatus TaxID=2770505 RepID=UPI0013DBCF9C|nr:tetratricopeptide repeat protein [Candidatus Laterigemmans baculatus]